MNLLSILSFGNFIGFVLFSFYLLFFVRNRTPLHWQGLFVCISLGIWNLFYTFFYIASDVQTAMLFHRLAAIGMYSFPPFTLCFFLLLTRREMLLQQKIRQIIFWSPPFLFLSAIFFFHSSPLANTLVQSSSGLGWAYVNNAGKPMFWLSLLFLNVYIIAALYILFQWGRQSRFREQKRQAMLFLIIDGLIFAAGTVTDFILPLFGLTVPPMANLFTAIFLVFFYYIIRALHMFNIDLVASSELIFSTMLDPVLVLDPEGYIIQCNDAAQELLDMEKKVLSGMKLTDVFGPISSIVQQKQGEMDFVRNDSERKYIMFSKTAVWDDQEQRIGTVLHIHDITRVKKEELELRVIEQEYLRLAKELEQLAYNDPLTQIPNRRTFFYILQKAAETFQEAGEDFCVIYLDLNGFKKFNDSYGHAVGDGILIQTAERLHKVAGEKNMAARLGGDEFVLLFKVKSEEDITRMKQKLSEELQKPVLLFGDTFEIRIAMGSSRYSEDPTGIEKLLHRADQSMYEDKHGGKKPENESETMVFDS